MHLWRLAQREELVDFVEPFQELKAGLTGDSFARDNYHFSEELAINYVAFIQEAGRKKKKRATFCRIRYFMCASARSQWTPILELGSCLEQYVRDSRKANGDRNFSSLTKTCWE